MSAPSAAFLAYAAFINGRCDKCGRILPHPDSDAKHECEPLASLPVEQSRPE